MLVAALVRVVLVRLVVGVVVKFGIFMYFHLCTPFVLSILG